MLMQPGSAVAQQREHLQRTPAASRQCYGQRLPGSRRSVLVAEHEPPVVLEYPPQLHEAFG